MKNQNRQLVLSQLKAKIKVNSLLNRRQRSLRNHNLEQSPISPLLRSQRQKRQSLKPPRK